MADKLILLLFFCVFWFCANFVIGSDTDNALDEGKQKTQFEAAFQGKSQKKKKKIP